MSLELVQNRYIVSFLPGMLSRVQKGCYMLVISQFDRTFPGITGRSKIRLSWERVWATDWGLPQIIIATNYTNWFATDYTDFHRWVLYSHELHVPITIGITRIRYATDYAELG